MPVSTSLSTPVLKVALRLTMSQAYDVSVVTPLRDDAAFVARCAGDPGHAAVNRHREKLARQYRHRLQGAVLVPLVAEVGGRWHSSVPVLVRRLARAYVARTPALAGSAAVVTGRWAARLSAALLRGNAAVVQSAQPCDPPFLRDSAPAGVPLPGCSPDGDCAYELLVR